MSKAAILLVYLRDSVSEWAVEHHLERYAKLAGLNQARIAAFARASKPPFLHEVPAQ
jgi:hypothetical protein